MLVLTLAFVLASGCGPARDQKQHNRGLDKPKPAKDAEVQ
jgi:hypothetical protein